MSFALNTLCHPDNDASVEGEDLDCTDDDAAEGRGERGLRDDLAHVVVVHRAVLSRRFWAADLELLDLGGMKGAHECGGVC